MTSSNRWTGRCKQQINNIKRQFQELSTLGVYHPSWKMMLWESPRLNDHIFRAAIQRWQIGTTKHRIHPKFYFRSFCFMATKISESLDRFQPKKTIGTEGQHLSPHHFSWFGPVKVGNFNWKMMKHAPVVISIQVLTIQLPGKVIIWGLKISEISGSKVPNKYNSFPLYS